jgi:hypothetical protein
MIGCNFLQPIMTPSLMEWTTTAVTTIIYSKRPQG